MKFEKAISKQLSPLHFFNEMSRYSNKNLTLSLGRLLYDDLESQLRWYLYIQLFTPINDQLKNEI